MGLTCHLRNSISGLDFAESHAACAQSSSTLIGSSSGDQTPFLKQCSVNDSRSVPRRQGQLRFLWKFERKSTVFGGYRVKKKPGANPAATRTNEWLSGPNQSVSASPLEAGTGASDPPLDLEHRCGCTDLTRFKTKLLGQLISCAWFSKRLQYL